MNYIKHYSTKLLFNKFTILKTTTILMGKCSITHYNTTDTLIALIAIVSLLV